MVMVIAEAGVNHNGSTKLAHDLVDAAKAAGATAVKFQMFDPDLLDPPGDRRNMLRELALDRDVFQALKVHATSIDIEFMATPFDVESLKFLVSLWVSRIKIGSADLLNRELMEAASTTSLGLIISTGMATIDDIAIGLKPLGNRGRSTVLLHCTSAYPTKPEDVNLRAMDELRKFTNCEIGLSDHSPSLVIPAAAVAMGAEVIEKHLTLDCRMDGPDHKASLEPRDFGEMVANIREVELAMGDGIKRPMPSEEAVMQVRDERAAWRAS